MCKFLWHRTNIIWCLITHITWKQEQKRFRHWDCILVYYSFKRLQHFNQNVFLYNRFEMFYQHWIIKRQIGDPSDKNTPCSLFSCCWLQPYWPRFHGSSEKTLTRNVAFLGILMHLFKKKYDLHVRNSVLNVCEKYVPVWGKKGVTGRAITGTKIILTCSLVTLAFLWFLR